MAFRSQLSASLYRHLYRTLSSSANTTAISPCLVRQLPPRTLCVSPTGSSFVLCGTLNLRVRGLHTAAAGFLCRDINLDEENPFYEKYRDKLGKIQGYIYYPSSLPPLPNSSLPSIPLYLPVVQTEQATDSG